MTLSRGAATGRICAYASFEISQKYDPNGSSPLAYHNGRHSLDVKLAAHQIGMKAVENGKIEHRNTTLLEIAACFHDVQQSLGSGNNEASSAAMAVDQMTGTQAFTRDEIDMVKWMILSTTVTFKDGIMHQAGEDMTRKNEGDYLCRILADADLATLGDMWEIYSSRMEALEKELLGDNPSPEKHKQFMEGQLRLLENHAFLTSEAAELFSHQSANADELRRKIALLG